MKTISILRENINKDRYMVEFTLSRFLRYQKVIFHGYDERNFKYLPKIVHCICERILKLCGCWVDEFIPSNTPFTVDFLYTKLKGNNIPRYESTYSLCSTNESPFSSPEESPFLSTSNPSEDGDPMSDSFSELSTLDGEEIDEQLLIENRCFQELETQKCFSQDFMTESIVLQDVNVAVDALLFDFVSLSVEAKKKVRQFQNEINCSQTGWAKINIEMDVQVLAALLYEWIENLKTPVLQRADFENIVINYKQPELCFQKFQLDEAYLIEYLLRFITKITPIGKDNQDDLIRRIIASCAQQSLIIQDKLIPQEKGYKRMGDGTLSCAIEFFQSLFELIEVHHSLRSAVYLEESNDVEIGNDFQ